MQDHEENGKDHHRWGEGKENDGSLYDFEDNPLSS